MAFVMEDGFLIHFKKIIPAFFRFLASEKARMLDIRVIYKQNPPSRVRHN